MSIFDEPADIFELETDRLILRGWLESDVQPWIDMNADPEVRRHFPTLLTPEESLAQIERYQRQLIDHGFGLYAVEARTHLPVLPREVPATVAGSATVSPTIELMESSDAISSRAYDFTDDVDEDDVVFMEPGTFLGFIGLLPMNEAVPPAADGTPIAWEIGWRLRAECWGQGLATEGAIAVRDYAFGIERFHILGSYTTQSNTPSIAVMNRIGFTQSVEFRNESLPEGFQECVLHTMTRNEWLRTLPNVS